MRVVLVDDQKLVRQGFRLILAVEPDITVVGEATNGAEGVDVLKETAPDVVLMDVQMPVMDGVAATAKIREFSDVKVVILTTFDRDDYLFDSTPGPADSCSRMLRQSRSSPVCVRSLTGMPCWLPR